MKRVAAFLLSPFFLLPLSEHQVDTRPAPSKLHLEQVGSDSTSFDVIATMIVGPTELLLWDAQYHVADAERLADRIAATGKHLKAIVLSHPDHDHFAGALIIVRRFPGTPVYMAPAGLAEYQRTAAQFFNGEKSRRPELLTDSIVTVQPLPSLHLTVDGEAIEVVPDLNGDVEKASNSVLWIPSLKTALVADLAFNGVHPWLGASSETSRNGWRAALKKIQALKPDSVIPGHKRDVTAPDTPAVLAFMDRYLADFDSLRKVEPDGKAMAGAMLAKYPELAVANLAWASAMISYRPAPAN